MPDSVGECSVCSKEVIDPNSSRLAKSVMCDLCCNWYHAKCEKVEDNIYKAINSKEGQISLYWVCSSCLKPSRGIMKKMAELVQKLNQYEDRLKTLENKENNEEAVKTYATAAAKEYLKENPVQGVDPVQGVQDYKNRIERVEKVIKDKKLDDEHFPPLSTLTNQALSLKKVIGDHKKLDVIVKKQSNTIEEDKRREEKHNSLIVYGVPENKEEAAEQMKEDFETVKSLYTNKVDLCGRDLINISRLGRNKTTDKIRPIKLVFANHEKRLEVLRNNKNLILTSNEFPVCSSDFCNDREANHTHIYVSPDKTKQQREEEKKLRDELKTRRLTEPNLIIRDGKIIKKSTIARWVNLREDD